MILTTCAACAAPLAHNAPRCIRCHTRYCNATCQHDHWRRGHKQICKKIHRGGNAEQYYADKKYKEAVAEAVEACRGRHEGQKCYICLEAVHPRTGEGLVRGCGCGDRDGVSSPELGVAHVSCLARQVKILREEGVENNLGPNVMDERWTWWRKCSLCEQEYHGVVAHALGWACWKTYVGRPETDRVRGLAMTELGNGLFTGGNFQEALSVYEADLSMMRRLGASEDDMLVAQGNLANVYQKLGRFEEGLSINREVYLDSLKLHGKDDFGTLVAVNNYAWNLQELDRHKEVKTLMHKQIPVAQRVLGKGNEITLRMTWVYGQSLYKDDRATLDDLREAATRLEDAARIGMRALGSRHPLTVIIEGELRNARAALRARDGGVSAIRAAVEAMTSGGA